MLFHLFVHFSAIGAVTGDLSNVRPSHTLSSVPIFSQNDCSRARTGSVFVLTPSSLRFRNITYFPLLRNHMLIASLPIARKGIGEKSSVKKRDIVFCGQLWQLIRTQEAYIETEIVTQSLRSSLFSRKRSLTDLFDSWERLP